MYVRFKRGFTLIELMIAITIISILASIAVPSLMRSRMSANEAAAIGLVREHQEGQHQFRRTDWDKDGIFEYFNYEIEKWPWYTPSPEVGNLWEDSYMELDWVATMDRAHPWGDNLRKNDYLLKHLWSYEKADPWSNTFSWRNDWQNQRMVIDRFGIFVYPETYNLTGVNMYFGSDTGPIYQQNAIQDLYYSEYQYPADWFPEDEKTRRKMMEWGETQWTPLD